MVMAEAEKRDRPEPDLGKPNAEATKPAAHDAALPIPPEGKSKTPVPRQLTEDEQMALYEKDLKDNDWGHQPC
jgi:hypothetical protein